MAGKKEYELAIKIAGLVDKSLDSSCNLTKKQLRSIAREAANADAGKMGFTESWAGAGKGIDAAWNGAGKAIKTTVEAMAIAGAVVGTVGGLAIHAGSDFESAFAGVIKTVDATDQQLADLEEGLREMAKNMPMTAVELSNIAEAAGQLGIETENIEEFTKVMADLSVATNLTSEDAASQFAKFANITGMAQTEFSNLGSSVVALGNNFATTEADIVAMAMRLAGAGKQVGMTEADIMGMATALSSVGIEAEAGGSAMSKVMVNMQLAVEKGQDAWKDMREVAEMAGMSLEHVISTVNVGGKSLNTLGQKTGHTARELKNMAKQAREAQGDLASWATVADMTSEQFVKAFKEDAAGAISSFIIGLSDTERMGQSAILTLDEMDIKEVRLRDTLLRGAGASELFADALTMANDAFEENTALVKEAEQRYRTFESKVDMVGNRINDAGITLYQSFRDPLSDILDLALEVTDNMDFLDSKHIDDMAKRFQSSIPTIVRHIRNAKDAFLEFASPFIAVGDWMIENPDIIAGTLAGIGVTITTLKLTDTVLSTARAMDALRIAMMGNPITAAIGIAAIAGGAIVGIGTKLKVARREIAKQGLHEAFGDITLSMSDLEEATNRILGPEMMDRLSVASGEVDQFKNMAAGLKDTSESITKITWKVGMGMELSEADTNRLESDITEMIESSVEFAEQAQYTAHVNMSVLFSDGDAEGDVIKNGFNSMYRTLGEKIEEKGRELGEVWKAAMEDGMITPIETETIQKLQKELADLNNMVADIEYDAKFYSIQQKHSGAALNPESFKNMQGELNDQERVRLEALYASYGQNMSNLDMQLELSVNGVLNSKEDGYITKYMHEERRQAIQKEFDSNVLDIKLNNINFQSQSIVDAFSEQMDPVVSDLGNNLTGAIEEAIALAQEGSSAQAWEWDYAAISSLPNFDGISKEAELAMGNLWKDMEVQFNELVALKKQYEDAGKEVPRSLIDGINDAAAIGIIAGSDEALWAAVANIANDNPSQKEALLALKESGAYMPEELANGITENIPAMESGVDELHRLTQVYLDNKFDTFSVNPEVDFNFTGTPNYALANPYGQIGKRARGGIVTSPEISWIAEAGYPEAVVPLDGSGNAVSIWQEAGERLGVLGTDRDGTPDPRTEGAAGDTGSSGGQIIFAPVYNIASGDEGTIRNSAEDAYQQFVQFMESYQKTNRRLSMKGRQ